jgi:hypothetical protein
MATVKYENISINAVQEYWVFPENHMLYTHGVFMCFIWFSKQTAVAFLNTIKKLIFVVEI